MNEFNSKEALTIMVELLQSYTKSTYPTDNTLNRTLANISSIVIPSISQPVVIAPEPKQPNLSRMSDNNVLKIVDKKVQQADKKKRKYYRKNSTTLDFSKTVKFEFQNSKVLDLLEYSTETKELAIAKKDKSVIRLADVPKTVVVHLIDNERAGTYFRAHIETKFHQVVKPVKTIAKPVVVDAPKAPPKPTIKPSAPRAKKTIIAKKATALR